MLRDQVLEFCRVYEHPTRTAPGLPSEDRSHLCMALIVEEFFEFLGAMTGQMEAAKQSSKEYIERLNQTPLNIDLVEMADALGDLDYVNEFCRLSHGIDGGPIADEIQRSNLSKLGADGKPMKNPVTGKTVKGPNFSPPDIARLLRKQGWTG